MWYQNIWLKKTVVFVVLAILYTLLPPEAKGLVGSFAVGWMLVDITGKVFD
jgi:Na+-transporting methylmalonyl-CoA/oxaloacetate decarboxylase beta subunit